MSKESPRPHPGTWRARLDFTAGDPPTSLEFSDPVAEWTTTSLGEVPGVLAAAEQAARDGLHVLGFVTYDAAPAFDPAFSVPSGSGERPGLPLACFVGFSDAASALSLDTADCDVEALWQPDDRPEEHAAVVDSIRTSIAEGDAYLVNHTTRLRRSMGLTEKADDLYRRLVTNYGRGWHLFLESDAFSVACGSPELFFSRSGSHLTTQPMKGTAPRGRWAAEDRSLADRLVASPKERAENVMVVDLLRNDLGRICVPGSIGVPAIGVLEQHPSLWQLTSTVTGTLAAGQGLPEIFGALFPSASVTGAPKIAAMELISAHESSARGLYCGAVGYLAPGGATAQFAVAIRTAVIDRSHQCASYGSGGGISWESTPAAEWAEVLTKAASVERGAPGRLAPGEGLIETMRFDPTSRRIENLEDHLARLRSSAAYFQMAVPEDLRDQMHQVIDALDVPTRIRLAVFAEGLVEITAVPLGEDSTSPQLLALDLDPVYSEEIRLFHKTTDRARYEERMARHPQADQVVLINERGEVTETNRANLAVKLEGVWWTPAIESGLLPGVERARLLRAGRLTERTVTRPDLERAEEVATLSSLRGWSPARLLPEEAR